MPTGYAHGLVWPLLVKYYGNMEFVSNYRIYHVNMPKVFRLSEQYLIRAEHIARKKTLQKRLQTFLPCVRLAIKRMILPL